MKVNKKAWGVLVMVLLLSIFSLKGSDRVQTMKNPSNQFYPAIYEDIMVWEDDRDGNLNIYGYNLSTGNEFQITTNEKDQLLPAIYGDYVVWQDSRNGNWDIYSRKVGCSNAGCSLRSPVSQIGEGKGDQLSPAIWGDYVVWEDNRNGNWDIYGYRITTERDLQITTERSDQRSPAIYGDIVVWQDYRNGNWDIYGYNLSEKEEFPITISEGNQQFPAIFGDYVVWMDNRNGDWDIYWWSFSEKEDVPITTNEKDQRSPAIFGDYVVWQDDRYNNGDIYWYSISEKEEVQITTNEKDQRSPAIYEDLVVWTDYRNGNWNIYGYRISTEKEDFITTNEGDQCSPAIYGDYIVWEGFKEEGHKEDDLNEENSTEENPSGGDSDSRDCNKDIYGYSLSTEEEVQITSNEKDQLLPAIYGDYVVWEDSRNGNWDIYGYNLLTNEEFQITTDPSDQKNPAIYGDIVIWEDYRNDNWDIYGYNLLTKEEFQITTDESNQRSPAIYGDIVVWEDDRNGNSDIYMYDLLKNRDEDQITTNKKDQFHPAIYRDYIVWQDNRHDNWDIHGYDLSTRKEFQITTNEEDQRSPAIYGDTIVWQDHRHYNSDIYGYDLSTRKEFQITTNEEDQRSPAIYGDTIVWQDHRNGNWDIYRYDLPTEQIFPVRTGEGDQYDPAIYGDIVIWEDSRNGNWDIYGYNLLTNEEFQITTDPSDQKNPAIYGDIVIWEDYRNDNSDIYGYNLLTGKEFQITTNESNQRSPAIYGDIVIWEHYRNGNWDILGCKLQWEDDGSCSLSSLQQLQITIANADQRSPAIYENIVVWRDLRQRNWGILGYDISEESNIPPIQMDENNKLSPAIYKNIVVWQDYRNGNWDIYGHDLSTKEEFLVTKSSGDQSSPAIYENIVVWEDLRHGNSDIYGRKLQMKDADGPHVLISQEFQITTNSDDQSSPAIYGDTVVWRDDRDHKRHIYYYSLSKREEIPIIISSIEQPESSSPVFAGILTSIAIIILIYGIIERYTKLFKHESTSPSKREMENSKVYEVNALKDLLSSFVLGKGRRWHYFAVLFLFIFSQVVISHVSETLTEIDINSLPREKVVFLKEEVSILPMWREPVFILYCVTAIIIFFPAMGFFDHIPESFRTLFRNGIIKKRENTCEKVLIDTEKSLKDKFNESLRGFENRLNGSNAFFVGFLLCGLGAFTQYHRTPLRELSFVSWNNFDIFPRNWVVFCVVALSMFFLLGIFIWKMLCVVHFMWRLNKDYDLVLKPYDTDGLGGFKPFEQLWVKMSFVAVPVLVDFIILSVLNYFSSTPFYPIGKFSDLILCSIVIVFLLIVPILSYYRIVKAQKVNLLDSIECKIRKYYDKIEEVLLEEDKDVDKKWMEQIKQYQEIELKVKSIPSLPFATYKRTYLFFIAIIAIIPCITQFISYGQSFFDIIISWII